ncbi:cytochrome c-type biogenesis protein CcdA [Geobacter sp. OR-1]|uniref:cytochrome c biogenesis CcdA family protein n=1 Tax=Geobacter sp. OR-1 TaxID=1266765 RepID=UPI000542BAA0|nr:cytochrome c biogenesis protein CcdA [Geobacter sp. OR-1]GAM07769.1 cytochrome c-type biogenesis protein CcdA [Geobacter sp. OR-1]
MGPEQITFAGAFVAGLLSFLSPCVLPLIPSYITYLTGLSLADFQEEHPPAKVRRQAAIHSLLFISGFTAIFVLLGASATFIGGFLQTHAILFRRVGGLLIIAFGIHITGLVPIHLLLGEKRITIHRKPAGYLGSVLVGVAFAAGWTPCIGPILASILMVAAAEETVLHGIGLLLAYSLGLAIPFFVSALAMNKFLDVFSRFKKHIRLFEVATGVFLIVVGMLLFTDSLNILGQYISRLTG